MRKLGLLLPPRGLLLVVVLFLIGCGSQDGSWERIQQSGVLRVGVDATYPPFAAYDGERPFGVDIDLAYAVAEELGLEAQFTYFGYDGLYDSLTADKVDVLISGLVVAPERTRDFAYSIPYFNSGQLLLVPPNSSLTSIEQLSGHTIAVELGAEGHVILTEAARKTADISIQTYNSPEEAFAAAASGQADGLIIDAISGRLFLKETPALTIIDPALTEEPFAIVTRVNDERLMDNLNASLVSLTENGTLQTILATYLE